MEQCGKETEVFSRIVGYFRPLRRWNEGKAEEFRQRLTYDQKASGEEPSKERIAVKTSA
jgi:ribonucleoside-triphosphate reductase